MLFFGELIVSLGYKQTLISELFCGVYELLRKINVVLQELVCVNLNNLFFKEISWSSISLSIDMLELDLCHLLLLPPLHLGDLNGPRVHVPRVEEPDRIPILGCSSDHHYNPAGWYQVSNHSIDQLMGLVRNLLNNWLNEKSINLLVKWEIDKYIRLMRNLLINWLNDKSINL